MKSSQLHRLKKLEALLSGAVLAQAAKTDSRGVPREIMEQIARDYIDSDVLAILHEAKNISPAVESGAMQATARVTRAIQLDQSGKIQGLITQMLNHITPDAR